MKKIIPIKRLVVISLATTLFFVVCVVILGISTLNKDEQVYSIVSSDRRYTAYIKQETGFLTGIYTEVYIKDKWRLFPHQIIAIPIAVSREDLKLEWKGASELEVRYSSDPQCIEFAEHKYHSIIISLRVTEGGESYRGKVCNPDHSLYTPPLNGPLSPV